MNRLLLTCVLALGVAFLFAGCGDHRDHGDEHGHEHGEEDHHAEGPHGGMIADIGDHEAHLEIIVDHDKRAVIAHVLTEENEVMRIKDAPVLNLKFADETKQLTGKAVDMNADGASEWHFRDDALAGEPESGRFKIIWNGKTYQVDFTHDHEHDHGHDHDGDHDHIGPHDGMMAHLHDADGNEVGMVELKLHDDKGDLELWLTDAEGNPFDIPCDAEIGVSFNDVETDASKNGTSVTLRVRNKDKNEDEDGNATMRDGNVTNYFIFPGDSGADASWLMGTEFEADVKVEFAANGKTYHTEEFDLEPHTHHAGDHDHEHK